MDTRVVTVTDFKSDPDSYLEALARDAESITITRRGRPVAVLTPAPKPAKVKKHKWGSSMGSFAKKGKIVGDIVNSEIADLYDCLK